MSTALGELLVLVVLAMLGHWLNNKRYGFICPSCSMFSLSISQARYFKAMLKAAGHLENVKRQRVSENDLLPWQPYYEVSVICSATL